MEDKRLPHHLDAEMSVLGALLTGDSKVWDEINDYLGPEDFYKPAHSHVFRVAQKLEEKGEPIDSLTVSDELQKAGELEKAGGTAYLGELMGYIPAQASVSACARIIKEKSLLRSVIRQSRDFISQAQAQEFESIDVFLDQVESKVFKISQEQNGPNLTPINTLVTKGLEHLESLHEKGLTITGLSTSFEELDNITSGFQAGDFVVVAARPSMGKTALSLNIALQSALKGKKVAFFSIEMAKEQLLIRLFSLIAGIPLSSLKVGKINKEWDYLMEGASRLSETHFFIDDSSHVSPFDIRSRARKMKAQHGLDLIVIDYIQLMSMKKQTDSREREVSEISRLLKAIAKELGVPVLALSQLNRGVESRNNKKPLLSDLRESGSIEQDADLIIMLYRDEYYNTNSTQKGKIELIINKQRNGPTGVVTLKWQPEYGRFENNVMTDFSPMPDHP